MKVTSLFVALFLSGIWTYGQNLIGYRYKDIRNYMSDNRREMNYNKIVNTKYNYLKYTDNSDSQTLLFFLDNDSVCKSIRMICDIGLKTEKVNEFNSLYTRTGKDIWIERRNNKEYIVEIKDDKWSCIITIEPHK